MSSDLSLHCNMDLLKQAPDYMTSVNTELRNASQSMRDYYTALAGTGYLSRTNNYTTSYSNILSNIGSNTNTLVAMRSDIEADITEINNFNPDLTADVAAIEAAAAELDLANNSEEIAAATAASETAEVSEKNSFWDSWFGKALSWIGHALEDIAATIVGLITSLFEAVANLLEDVVDLLVTVGVGIASFVCSAINVIFGTDIPVEKWENWCKCFVAHDFSGSVFSALYNNTGFGQWIAGNDLLHGIHDTVVDSLEWVGIAVLGAFTCGAASAALGAAKGFGSTAEKAYANGASFWGGMAGATVMGVIDGFIGYGIGNAANTVRGALSSTYKNPVKTTLGGNTLKMWKTNSGLHTKLNYKLYGLGTDATFSNAGSLWAKLLGTSSLSAGIFTGSATTLGMGLAGVGSSLLLGALDPSKSGGVIDTNNPFKVDYELYDENGQYQGFHDGQHLKHQGDPNDPNATPTDDGDDEDDDKKPEEPEDNKPEKDKENDGEEKDDTPEEEERIEGAGEEIPTTGGGTTGGGGTTIPVTQEVPVEEVPISTDGGGNTSTTPTYEPEPVDPVDEIPVDTGDTEDPGKTDDKPVDEIPEDTGDTDKPVEEIPKLSPETEDEWPEITVTNVGPKEVVLPGSNNNGYNASQLSNRPATVPEFSAPEETTPETPVDPMYNWESASPTIEAPDMTGMSAEETVNQVASKQIEVQAVETTGSATLADVTEIENLNASYNTPGFDTSMLGMGTAILGAGGATTYGAVKSKEEDEDKKEVVTEFAQKVNEETKKDEFNQ